jgi:hypothetical protein
MQAIKFVRFIAIFTLLAASGSASSTFAGDATMMTLPPQTKPTHDGSRDFDFLYGKWSMRNWRLLKRLANAPESAEYDSTAECHPLPGGIGNQDVYYTDYWPGFVGLTFRIYDRESRLWTIYWIDNRNNYHGKLEAPVVGSFDNGVGIFEGPDEFDGKPIVVRYTWTIIDHDHAHFEQAFSPDGGRTWEMNFKNDLTRVAG